MSTGPENSRHDISRIQPSECYTANACAFSRNQVLETFTLQDNIYNRDGRYAYTLPTYQMMSQQSLEFSHSPQYIQPSLPYNEANNYAQPQKSQQTSGCHAFPLFQACQSNPSRTASCNQHYQPAVQSSACNQQDTSNYETVSNVQNYIPVLHSPNSRRCNEPATPSRHHVASSHPVSEGQLFSYVQTGTSDYTVRIQFYVFIVIDSFFQNNSILMVLYTLDLILYHFFLQIH